MALLFIVVKADFETQGGYKSMIKMTEWKLSNLLSVWTASETVWVLSGGEILLRKSDIKASTWRNSLSTGFGAAKGPANLPSPA